MESKSEVETLVTAEGREYVRTPDACFKDLEGYDFSPNYVEVSGLRVHYLDEGPSQGDVVLMLHGQPTWSYLYRKMITPVAEAGYRVIAPDLIGMGRSDKPIGPNTHTIEQHVAWMVEFLDALGLVNISLVCQDWGGVFGLRMVGDDPARFARVFAANAIPVRMDINPLRIPKLTDRSAYPVDPQAKLRTWDDFIAQAASLIGEDMSDFFFAWVKFALTAPDFRPSQNVNTRGQSPLTPGEIRAYDAPFPSEIYCTGPRTLPSMAGSVDEERNQKAWASLGRYDRPFVTVFGKYDPLVGTQRHQDMLIDHIPGTHGQAHDRIEAGHFIQENAGEQLAASLVAFLRHNALK